MKSLRRSFNRFCFQNRNKGIPNLMLYLVLGSAVVYLISMLSQNYALYDILCFDRDAILHGQVWRLFSYAFLYHPISIGGLGGHLLTAFALYCFYTFGRSAEMRMGTFKFNLYFLSGIILQDIFCMVTGSYAEIDSLKLSMFLVFATQCPDARIFLYGFIPIKAWVWALVNIGIITYEVIALRAFFPHNLFPLISIVNFLLFFGDDLKNLIPMSWRVRFTKKKSQKKTGTIPFPGGMDYPPAKSKDYNHRCEVCGRTDVSNPELEFRYCSRCQGYHCYCEDHINNHEHVE